MSSESSRAVKIRLEIEVPQGGAEPVVVQQQQQRPTLTQRPSITQPPPATIAVPTPTVHARQDSSGHWLICAQGTNGVTDRPVFGRVYARGAVSDTTPPDGALWVHARGASGQWGVQSTFELPVVLTGSSQVNTLVVWNDDDSFTPQSVDFMIIQSTFTECQNSGAPHGFAEAVTDVLPGAAIPQTLYAHISNEGALDKAHELRYDPNTKAWNSDAVCGPLGLRLACLATHWQLHVRGSRIYQASIEQAGPARPLQIVFPDVDLDTPDGGGAGNASVEILESAG